MEKGGWGTEICPHQNGPIAFMKIYCIYDLGKTIHTCDEMIDCLSP